MTEQQGAEGQGSEGQVQKTASQANATEGQGSEEEAKSTDEIVPISALREREAENKKYRARIKELEAKEEERTNAEKSELEKTQGELQKRDERIQTLERKLRRSTFNEKIGLPNAKRAWAVAIDEGIEIDFDEDDQPKNLEAVRKALREADPALFGDGTADAGAKTNGTAGYQGSPGRGRLEHAYSNNK